MALDTKQAVDLKPVHKAAEELLQRTTQNVGKLEK